MISEVRFADEFTRAFKRLKKRFRSLPQDLKRLLASLVDDPHQGTELYNGMRKVRLSFPSKGRGKRGGGRVSGRQHIKPAEEYAVSKIESEIKRRIQT